MPLLVFTDLDGTLLSHEDYDWRAALPALTRLKTIGAGVIMASSKTAPEIEVLQQETGLSDWPAIVENGAGLLDKRDNARAQHDDYARLRAELDSLPDALRKFFRGFGDMSVSQIAEVTGLAEASATLAARRRFSEPGTWSGATKELETFQAHLKARGIFAREGGRFLTLSFGKTKADQMARIITRYTPHNTVALGDAPNDIEMLQAADFGIIVANPHRTPLPLLKGEDTGRVLRTDRSGPEGWNEAMLSLLARLHL
ncbi:mannosyl-3-phosphoglycerate phosphatase [Sulfitobacter noctilucicola]|uniref:Mannosyl-3-phosphoglycerate phosphatase n=2 Tax=Sulfitobacter noctilucicola TaxID=1342301 RepID=A0A7W6M8P1_9RHOB|nr:mannosyl-3-phosphoglycerate phosphatase [Sulfitobacter noctilucicola]